MKKTMMLVAAHQLIGAVATSAKDRKGADYVVEPGTELTSAVLKKLDLDDEAVERLKETGAIAEVSARVSEEGSDGDLVEQLRDANQRASEAETKLEAETKRADAAEAQVKAHDATIAQLRSEVEKLKKPGN